MGAITRGDDDGGPGADAGGADSGGGSGGDLGYGDGSPGRVGAAGRPDDGGGNDVQRQSVTVGSGRVGPRASGHDLLVDSEVGGNGSGGNLSTGRTGSGCEPGKDTSLSSRRTSGTSVSASVCSIVCQLLLCNPVCGPTHASLAGPYCVVLTSCRSIFLCLD